MSVALTLAEQSRMVAVLRAQLGATLIETHISFVLLTTQFAFKIKKAVNLGFVDFSTLALRRHFCEEELRLNRRLAPALYLDLLPLTGSVEQPVWGGSGEVIDWAVRMHVFAQRDLWDQLALHGELKAVHIDGLVEQLARFYRRAAVAGRDGAYGQPEQIRVRPAPHGKVSALGVGLVARRQHKNRNGGPLSDLPNNFDPIDIGKAQIEQDHVRISRLRLGKPVCSSGRLIEAVAMGG